MSFDVAAQLRDAACLFLDCDGVIFDANRFKLAALDAAMAGYPETSHGPMRAYWKLSGGISRYVKFDHYVRAILGLEGAAAEAAIADTVSVFAAHSRAGYAPMAPLPEALQFADRVGPEHLVVISGTDHAELNAVFRDKGLQARFPCVLGSPTTKPEHLRSQLAARSLAPEACLFIGDGAGDLRAAQACEVPFVFLAELSEWQGADTALSAAHGHVARVESWRELLALAGAG